MDETVIVAPAESLSVRIYSDLRMKLIVGDLKPGAPLSIRTLAEECKVSAMPVREALRQLASEGALIGEAKKSYRVPNLSTDEAANLFFVQSVLEGAAAEVAANRAKTSDFKILSKLKVAIEKAWIKQDARIFLRENYKFHSHICSLADNGALQSMIESLYVRTGPWLAYGIVNLVKPDDWMGRYGDIIEAMKERDATKVRRLLENDALWGMSLYRQ